MKKMINKGLFFIMAVGTAITVSGCSDTSVDDNALTETEQMQDSSTQTSDENMLAYTNAYYENKGGTIYKYIVSNGHCETEIATETEIEELQLNDLMENRILVWQDNFSSEELNTDIWGFEEGHLRNNEIQYYLKDSDNLTIQDGVLNFVAKRENKQPGYDWTSASIHTKNSKQFCKGRMEARIKIDNVAGAKAKFWTGGVWGETVWPQKGQIDICELQGRDDKYFKMTGNVYYAGPNMDTRNGYGTEANSYENNLVDGEYHIYAVEWSDDAMTMYIDDNKIGTFSSGTYEFWNNCNPFRLPQFLRLNLAVTSDADKKVVQIADNDESGEAQSEEVVETLQLAKDINMNVDWVRVYALPEVDKALQLVPNKVSVDYLGKVGKADKITFSDMEYTGNLGDIIYLGAVYLPQTVVERSCEYAVDNEEVATIEQDGRLTVNGSGTVVVTVTDKTTGISGQRKIRIKTE